MCSQMLPKVGDTFVKFSLYSKVYKDSKVDKEKGIEAKTADWCADNVVYGSEYKPFGLQPLKRWRRKVVQNGSLKRRTNINLLM